jgi:type VI secretion system secreted protein VgrG
MPEQRAVGLTTVLGDKLRFRRLVGEEALSRPFCFELELAGDDEAIRFEDLLGTAMAVEVPLLGGGRRRFHGLVARFAFRDFEGDEARYLATLRPWLWFLCRTTDCRIFQDLSVPDILRRIFAKYPQAEVEYRLSASYPPRGYCVQYRESDLDFVSRLMEDEGIAYFFVHAEDKHTLVLADAPEAHQAVPDYEEVPFFFRADRARRARDHVYAWNVGAEVRSGSVVHTAFDFEKPRADLTARRDEPLPHALAEGELYDYPGPHREVPPGENAARIRLEAEQAQHCLVQGEATAAGLAAGHRFKLARYPRADQNAEHLLREVTHEIWDPAYRSGERAGEEVEVYRCRFTALPADRTFRPPSATPKPVVRGPQTAIVTGPAGEEIHTDKYGRVKIQFHWDRESKRDEKSSCWVRVSQPWAGTGFGAMVIPRIGQEVIVDFLEGDPDRPIITGRVYNAQAMPPYLLPAGQNQSGLKSNSTKGGGGSNELTFDDTKGKERVYLHAQFNSNAVVENDKTETVHNNETITIDANRTESVGADEKLSVGANRERSVGGNETVTVGGNQEETIGIKHTLTVGADQEVVTGTSAKLTAGLNREVSAALAYKVEATTVEITGLASITLKVGGSSIKIDPSGVSILGPIVKLN